MHRAVRHGRPGRFAALAALVASFSLCAVVGTAIGAPTKVFVFGAKPNAPFEVLKNTNLIATATSSPIGSVNLSIDATSGDRLDLIGPDTAPPVPPLFSSLETNNPGCATAAWLPSGDPTVVGYVLSFGTQSVAGGENTHYEQSVEVGASTLHTECVLLPGTYYFAIQARNADGVMSAYSSERSVLIQTVAVLISTFGATVAEDGVRLAWRVEADEVVRGFHVYRSEGTAPALRLTDDLIDASATSFVDAATRASTSYTYVLSAVKENGDEVQSVPASVTTPALALSLGQNYPNPFNPTTRIPFALETTGRVVVRVFDIRGAHVATVLDQSMEAGRHSVEWSGRDENGGPVASGLYFYQLTSGTRTLSRKMMLVK